MFGKQFGCCYEVACLENQDCLTRRCTLVSVSVVDVYPVVGKSTADLKQGPRLVWHFETEYLGFRHGEPCALQVVQGSVCVIDHEPNYAKLTGVSDRKSTYVDSVFRKNSRRTC